MSLRLITLFVLAIAAQLATLDYEGFDPTVDGLQLASATTLGALVIAVVRHRRQQQKVLILRILDELGQPITVLRGYLSLLSDGTINSLNEYANVFGEQCDRITDISKRLIEAVRELR